MNKRWYDVDPTVSLAVSLMRNANIMTQYKCAEYIVKNSVMGYSALRTINKRIRLNRGKVSYALMPVYLLSTKWQDKNYLFAMNGQTGKFVGDIPTETKKASLIGIIGGAVAGAIIYGIATLISFL